ncbi:hypothetical protein H0H92_007163 [Tricholoma furcatifolium]|nr:hypothetical protein H0H92_007163 [Tricholoma furcatifolium]
MTTTLPLGTSLGAIVIGCIIAAMIYGASCFQMWSYARTSRDRMWFKCYIVFLWILDSVHMGLIIHCVYHYSVLTYGDADALTKPVWSVLAQVFFATWSDTFVRAVYCRRIWLVSKKNRILTAVIVITAMFTVIFATIFTAKSFSMKHFSDASAFIWFLYAAFAGVISSDILIAGSLCWTLTKYRTAFKNTNDWINTLMMYSVNTMYFMSLLAALNTRDSLWEKCFGGAMTMGGTTSDSGFRVAGLRTQTQTNSSIMVKMERVVEIDGKSSAGEDLEMKGKFNSSVGQ